MEPGGHVVPVHDVAMDERDVILSVAVVPERHDPEMAETARQVRDRLDAHADAMRAEAFAVVVPVPLDQVVERGDQREVGGAGLGHAGKGSMLPTGARPGETLGAEAPVAARAAFVSDTRAAVRRSGIVPMSGRPSCARRSPPGNEFELMGARSGMHKSPALITSAIVLAACAVAHAADAPVETGPPNVPEFKPAFPGQTRAPAVTTRTPLQVTEIASGFNKPWAIAFLPDRRMLVTEKPTGHLYIVTPEGAKSKPVAGLPRVDGRNQGGLLDVELSPDFARSGIVYWSYYEPREGGNGLTVARAKLVEGEAPRIEGLQIVFRMQPTLESTMHCGGRLVFAPDGTLFVVLGERGIMAGRVQAQDLGSHFGKVVRIHPDGTVPKGNPFVARRGARPEIWSLGHRNILSAALDERDRLWVVEMGPRGGDELNRVERGKDYGWPTIGYGEEYSGRPIHKSTRAPGMEQPVYFWTPDIAPAGSSFM